MKWQDVSGWVAKGGAILGARRKVPKDKWKQIAERLEQHKIQGLLIIGGYEGFGVGLALTENREKYPAFRIPIVVAPSCINNDVPGTEFCLGCDTALNEIVEICDSIRQSAQGTKRRVFVVETMGRFCGYLATLAGIAAGADATHIYEERFTIEDLVQDIYYMATKMSEGVERGLVLRNERASFNYTTDFIARLYAEEGRGIFSTRMNILGHMQQGDKPTPFDRNVGTKMGSKAAHWLADQLQNSFVGPDGKVNATAKETSVLLGIQRERYRYIPLIDLKEQANFEEHLPKEEWWLRLRPLFRILAKHDSAYEDEGILIVGDYKK